ncbi:MAG: M56 family metallopeptidase [Ruminococcaceae bacterium]|nr:M56 family metallopeptidase [Oscillospiraceae bacterium]
MTELFITVVNMSISAVWVILAVLLLRLLLKKAPKWVNVLLWGFVAVRLICPFLFESALSLIPSSQTINPEIALNPAVIDSGVPIIDSVFNPVINSATITPEPEKELNVFKFIVPYLAGTWLVGIVLLLIYTIVSYVKLKKKIRTAVLLRDNIYQSEAVVSPFVLGIIKPKIYIPFNMKPEDIEHVISHETAHIKRKDHLWKPLGFLILTFHWFNPLVWIGYVLLCRDIELACDEKVVKELNAEQRADYSEALLSCSVNRRLISACPVAFGEANVKNRVKSVLNYKKPAFWVILVAVILSVVVAVCFLTNPLTHKNVIERNDAVFTDFDGVYITLNSIEKTEDYLTFNVEWHNETEVEITYGEMFYIEYKDGNKWVDTATQEVVFHLIGYLLKPDEVKQEVYKAEYNDISETGTYRLVVPFSVNGSTEEYKTWVEFELNEISTTQERENIEKAVAKAILDDNKIKYYDFGTECAAEGHIIYGTEFIDNKCKVYVLTDYSHFGFENGYFVEKSGGRVPAVMTFEKTTDGYKLLNIDYVEDGSRYQPSIEEMFPKKYQYRVMFPTEKDYENLWNQNKAYAKAYLDKIGRSEEIRRYSEVEHILLTDVGISVEVSNKILENKNIPNYNYDLGYFESVEDGVRYIYSKSYDKEKNKIICLKEVYDTKAVIERIEIDSLTGDVIFVSSSPKQAE